jgi:dipeptidase E
MRLYLSSYRVGAAGAQLAAFAGDRHVGFIPNALDHVEPAARAASNEMAMHEVQELGIDLRPLDLRMYFGNPLALENALHDLGGVWVRGGNTFVLRQAMRLSGFDEMLRRLRHSDFLYGGYSAGICVLAPRLDGLQQVDDPTIMPYPDSQVIFEGVGLLPYLILPHYRSDHPESALIEREVEYCQREGIPFRTLRDGEVIIIEDLAQVGSA